MRNKFISASTIYSLICFLVVSSYASAAYYATSDLPDYDIVTIPCHKHADSSTSHHHHYKHHARSSQHKRSSYTISKYYVYRNNAGDVIWMPSPCDCCGTWIKVREIKKYSNFFSEPYREPEYNKREEDDEIDFDMDRRTADDVEE